VDHRHAVHFAVRPEDDTPLGTTKPRRVLKECCQYRLKVEGRSADDLEDLCGGSLLIECFSEVAVSGLQLLEQPHVLDRDDGLIPEGLQQRDLVVGERPGLGARHRDDAEGSPLPQHWYPETAANTERAGHGLNRELRIELEDVRYVANRAL